MTFTEAAAQVLRLVGKPLHYKEITDVAIEKNLLSHVGKSPEVTMGARLAALVKKSDKENPLVRVKPGVFALRDWDPDTIARGLADRTPALERLAAAMAAAGEVLVDVEDSGETSAAVAAAMAAVAPDEPDDDEVLIGNEDDRKRAELAAGATDLFTAEEDDDKPIFGAAEDVEDEEAEEGGDVGGRRRGRRRRKRGRGTDDVRAGSDDLPSYTVSDPSTELLKVADAEVRAREGRSEPGREGRGDASRETSRDSARDNREPREAREPRESRDPREGREPRESREPRDARESRDNREPRDAREFRDNRESRDAREPRDNREFRDNRDARDNRESRDAQGTSGARDAAERSRGPQAPLDELVGRELGDALAHLLSGYDRNAGPVPYARLAEAAKRRGRLGVDIAQGQVLLEAVARTENLRRQASGQRPRFRLGDRRVGLTEWAMDPESQRVERDLYAIVERYREHARRSLLRRLQELPQRSFGELALLVLERIGFTELVPVRRPGTHGAELHLCGRLLGPAGEIRTAVIMRRDGREIGRERVTELRGALHHYGPANAGWLITAGQVLSGAKEEANAPGAAPVNLLDGIGLARLMEEQGIGVNRLVLSLPTVDQELFDALKSGG